MSIEAIKQMVHELEYVLDCINNDEIPFDGDDFHEALRLGRQAIAAERQEPDELTIAYMSGFFDGKKNRKWVGLTEQEAIETWKGIIKYAPSKVRVKDFAKAIDAKLREKNT